MSVMTGLGPVHVDALSDDELVQLARQGDEQAFNTIVRRYRAPLVSYCRRWLDPHRAEEVVQHTLMKAFLCLRDDDRPLALRPWLYRVAHNAALNALEKKGGDWEQLDENYDGVPQPPQVAEQRARFLKVVGEIEALPDRQREALLLNEFEGRCYADIATQLGTSESGVRGLLRRARSQLREAAAAIFLPFPALREFVRSDAGRSFHVDRAGEIVGAAGTAGGLSAVGGGFAKVAAGVLAAGTIAGGGTALEHGRNAWKTQNAEAQSVSQGGAGADSATARKVLALTASEDGTTDAQRLVARPDGSLVPELTQPPAWSEHEGSLEGVEHPAAEEEEAPVEADPIPVEPEDPLLGVEDPTSTGEDEEEGVEGDEPAADDKDEDPDGSPDGSPEDPEPAEEPGSAPATTGPITPLKS